MDSKIKPKTSVLRASRPASGTSKARRATMQPEASAARQALADKNLHSPGARDHRRSELAAKGSGRPASLIEAERVRNRADLEKMREAVTRLFFEWGADSPQRTHLQAFLSFGHTDDTKQSSADFGAALAFSDGDTQAVTNKAARGAVLLGAVQQLVAACLGGQALPANLDPSLIKTFCNHLAKLDIVSGGINWNRIPRPRAGRSLQTLYPTLREQYAWAATMIHVSKTLLSALAPLPQPVSAAPTSIKSANPFLDQDPSSESEASFDSSDSSESS